MNPGPAFNAFAVLCPPPEFRTLIFSVMNWTGEDGVLRVPVEIAASTLQMSSRVYRNHLASLEKSGAILIHGRSIKGLLTAQVNPGLLELPHDRNPEPETAVGHHVTGDAARESGRDEDRPDAGE